MVELKNCQSCKFELNSRHTTPCFMCLLSNEWRPREKEQDYKISSFQIDYSKELFLRVNKLLFDCREVRFSNHFVVSYDCIFRTKHCHVVITLWMHEDQMHCVYYFKHY